MMMVYVYKLIILEALLFWMCVQLHNYMLRARTGIAGRETLSYVYEYEQYEPVWRRSLSVT